jgi:DNA processing protein
MTVDDIALSMETGLNYGTVVHLVETFGSAAAVYAATPGELTERAELNAATAHALGQKRAHKTAENELKYMARNGIAALASTDAAYPDMLRECNDYPHILYIKGDPAALSAPTVSMVGTRRINAYGTAVCNRLVSDMARAMPELVIVSGLAFGVDVACHKAAIDSGLRTVGVLANPLPEVYPSAHYRVGEDMIRRGGAIVSELSSKDHPNKARFLQRNRIIAGMSQGTIVVQSPASGGSMITASLADGYNRCLMAPPANLGDAMSEGTNLLLRRQKARMVCSAADVFEELGWGAADEVAGARQENKPVGEGLRVVYECICEGGKLSAEQIETRTGIAAAKLMEMLLDLECDGFIRQAGSRYEKFKI